MIELNGFVGGMACQKQVVPGLYHPREPHKEPRIHTHGGCHIARYHLRRLVQVNQTREDEAPVSDGAPEVGGLGADGAVHERLERRRHASGGCIDGGVSEREPDRRRRRA